MSCPIIPFPQELRPPLPTIVGNVDYLKLRKRLEQIDALLREGGVEGDFVQRSLDQWAAQSQDVPSAQEQWKFQLRSRRALRCTILRTLLQEDYRGFSNQLGLQALIQDRFDATIGQGAEMQGPLAGGFEPGLPETT